MYAIARANEMVLSGSWIPGLRSAGDINVNEDYPSFPCDMYPSGFLLLSFDIGKQTGTSLVLFSGLFCRFTSCE